MTTLEHDPVQDRFHQHDPVRLLRPHGDHAAGTCGRIVGRFARDVPTWVVSFEGESPSVELRGDEIAPVAA